MMKLAISNIAWDGDPHQLYQWMVHYGFQGLEIAPTKFSPDPYDHLAIAAKVREELQTNYQFPIVSMQSLLFGTEGLALFGSVEKRQLLQDYLKKAIIYAETVHCPVLVFGNPKNRMMTHKQQDYGVAVDFFHVLGEFAAKHQTCLCIEPNPSNYGTNFINTLEEANQLVNEVKSPGFKMIVDTSTMLLNQDNASQLLPVLENTRHIHISMPFLKPINQEFAVHEAWLKQFFASVKQSHYSDYLSIEMLNINAEDLQNSLALISQLANSSAETLA